MDTLWGALPFVSLPEEKMAARVGKRLRPCNARVRRKCSCAGGQRAGTCSVQTLLPLLLVHITAQVSTQTGVWWRSAVLCLLTLSHMCTHTLWRQGLASCAMCHVACVLRWMTWMTRVVPSHNHIRRQSARRPTRLLGSVPFAPPSPPSVSISLLHHTAVSRRVCACVAACVGTR